MAVYLATRREVNTQAPQLSHGREAALKKGKRKPEKPSSPPLARFLGHACPGKRLFPGHVPLGHVRHAPHRTSRGASIRHGDLWTFQRRGVTTPLNLRHGYAQHPGLAHVATQQLLRGLCQFLQPSKAVHAALEIFGRHQWPVRLNDDELQCRVGGSQHS